MTKFRVKKRTIKLPLASAASEWPQNLLMSAFSHKVIPHLEGHIIPLFIRVGSDRTKGNGFKLRREVLVRYEEEVFHSQGGDALEQVAQGGCGCPIPGGIQGQAGCGSGQPGWVVGDPAHSRHVETR